MEPYKCEYVPVNDAVVFIMSIPDAFEKLYQILLEYRAAMPKIRSHYERQSYSKRIRCGPEAKAINAMLQLRFNYTDSYVNTGDCIWRYLMVYEDHRTKIQARGQSANA
jgi:hypothetical protein